MLKYRLFENFIGGDFDILTMSYTVYKHGNTYDGRYVCIYQYTCISV